MLLDRKPDDAIDMLETVLPFDSSLQETIDNIYGWCFDINGTLLIKPSLLYNDVELIGSNLHNDGINDDDGRMDAYYLPMTGDDFVDYVKYIETKFTLNDNETLESPTFIRYQFLDPATGAAACQISLFEYNYDLALSFEIPPEMNNTQYSSN